MLRFGLMAPWLLLSSMALAAQVQIAGVTASSTYPPDEAGSYDPKQLIDGKASTSWVEGEDGSGLGSWVELNLGGTHAVKSIAMWGGLWYSAGDFQRSNRPSEVEVRFEDGSTAALTLGNTMSAYRLELPKPVSTSTIRLKIKAIHSGNTWMDTAISEVQVFDTAAETRAIARTLSASSLAKADEDGSYEASQVSDNLKDTMWCEGNATGDGTGEWLNFEFDGEKRVSRLAMVNGIGTSLPFFMKGNRATAATLQFSNGSQETVAIKNSMMPQEIAFPPHQTRSVRITFTGIARGKEFNDLCISEAWFAE